MFDRRRCRDHRGHHPWRFIGLLGEWKVEWVDHIPGGDWGLTIHAERKVQIVNGLTQAERRSTIAHEAGHVLRGPAAGDRRLYEEALVERQAARLLIPSVRRIGHALAWNRADHERAAADLWVDEKLLAARLSTLAPKERQWLDCQMETVLL